MTEPTVRVKRLDSESPGITLGPGDAYSFSTVNGDYRVTFERVKKA